MAEQSPIDIPAAARIHSGGVEFHYGPSTVTIEDDGYVLRADPSGDDHVLIDGRTYRLLQFHLHSPAEHTFAGKRGVMELHLVHADDGDALGLIGILLEEGAHNPTLETLLTESSAVLDPSGLLPSDHAYVAYMGSRTTPPHTEGVGWRVLTEPIQLSSEQLTRFRAIHHGNIRPLQPLDGRDLQTASR